MTVIELGEITSGSPEPTAPVRRSDVRRIAVAAVAVLCALTVTGSSRPEPRGLPVLWSMAVGGGQPFLTADAVFVLDPGAGLLRAYAAADGAPRWSSSLDRQAGWINTEIPGTVLVPTTSGVLADGSSPVVVETLALDAATGEQRWRRAGDPGVSTPEFVLLTDWDGIRNGVRGMRVVGTGDGVERWALKLTETVASWTVTGAVPGRPDRLITVTGSGRMQARRLADGALVAETTMPPLRARSEDSHASVYGTGPHLFVVRLDGEEQRVAAYDGDTLRPRWERAGRSAVGVFECGALLCAGTADDAVEALDPVTGAVRWRSRAWENAQSIGNGMLLMEMYQISRAGLVDERTGRLIAEFDSGPSVSQTLLDRESSTVLSLGLTKTPPPRYTVRQRDPATSEVILRGAVPVAGDQGCQLAAGRLACTGGGTLTVTDVG